MKMIVLRSNIILSSLLIYNIEKFLFWKFLIIYETWKNSVMNSYKPQFLFNNFAKSMHHILIIWKCVTDILNFVHLQKINLFSYITTVSLSQLRKLFN